MGSVVNVSVGLTQEQIDALANVLYSQTPGGAVDGVNTVFTTTFAYTAGRTYLYKNGQQLSAPTDYTESGPSQLTTTFAPQVGDVMFVQYIRQTL